MSTRSTPISKHTAATAVTLGLLATLLSGCVAGAEPTSQTSPEGGATASVSRPAKHAGDAAAAALVPEAIAEDGALLIAADGTSSPDAMLAEDGTTLTGWQVDIGYAISDVLGLEARFENTGIPTIIPSLESKRYEMGVATFGITPARLKVLDFVGNFIGGTGFVQKSGQDINFGSIDNLCGHSVAVVQGTLQVAAAGEQNDKCAARGDEQVDMQQFPDKNAAALALTSGRVELLFLDSTTTGYMVKQDPSVYEEVGEKIFLGVAGIQMKKDSGLAQAVQAALQVLIDDGTYADILTEYGVEDGAVSEATINNPNVK